MFTPPQWGANVFHQQLLTALGPTTCAYASPLLVAAKPLEKSRAEDVPDALCIDAHLQRDRLAFIAFQLPTLSA
jgi:hypothetical protein